MLIEAIIENELNYMKIYNQTNLYDIGLLFNSGNWEYGGSCNPINNINHSYEEEKFRKIKFRKIFEKILDVRNHYKNKYVIISFKPHNIYFFSVKLSHIRDSNYFYWEASFYRGEGHFNNYVCVKRDFVSKETFSEDISFLLTKGLNNIIKVKNMLDNIRK